MSRLIKFFALTLVLALAMGLSLGLVGCAETQYQPGGEPSPAPPSEKLQILSHNMTTEGAYPAIKGTAKNVSSSRLSYAGVDVKFYDAAGTLIGNSSDSIRDLDPGETWSFEVIYCGFGSDKITSYKIGVGTTY